MSRKITVFIFLSLVGMCLVTNGVNARTVSTKLKEKQNFIDVVGNVTAADGSPLPGVSVKVKGGVAGTSTNTDGNFQLKRLSGRETLVFTFIGYKPQEIALEGKTSLKVSLQEDFTSLEEIVVIGYGTQSRKELTGSVSSIKSTELQKVVSSSFTGAIQGKVPGVTISQTTGAPGGAASVRIRGVGTTGSNEPLYVIDGFPVGGGSMAVGGSSDRIDGMSIVNPNDIESVEILKDAAAASIYGARAANGVVLITTKRGKEGVTTAEFNGYAGLQQLWKKPRFLNAEEFATLANELYTNSNMTPNPEWEDPAALGQGTDWINEVFRTAPLQNYDVNVSGGSQKIQAALSLGYRDQQGTLIETWNKRYTGRANVDVRVSNKLKFGGTLAFAYTHSKGQRNEDFRLGIFNLAQQFYPTLGLRDVVNGSSAYYSTQGDNPLLRAESIENYLKNLRMYGNAYGEYEITNGLKWRTSIGVDANNNRSTTWEPKVERGHYRNLQAILGETYTQGLNWLIENTLSYSKTINQHNISAVIGQTAQKNTNDWIGVTARDFQNENLQIIDGSAELERRANGTGTLYSLASYLGRINYSYQNKYLFSASIRRDGSSNFGPTHKWGNFPSFSGGWNISEEQFFKGISAINSLKLRASWGQLGNDAIGAFSYASTIGLGRVADNYVLGLNQGLAIGASMIRPGNQNLKWETSEQLNIGIDASFLNDHAYLTAEYYIKDTKDMLVSLPVSMEAGFESAPSVNGGKVRNKGLELLVGYNGNSGDFKYDVSVNLATLKNEVLSLGAGRPITGPTVGFTSMSSSYTEVGEPIGYFRGYIVDGIYQSNEEVNKSLQPNAMAGDFKFRDVNGDQVLSDADRVKLGSPWPSMTYGASIDLSYKGFDLNMLFQGVAGNEIFNVNKFSTYPIKYFGGSGVINASADVLDRWTPENGGNTIPRLTYTDANGNYANVSSFYIEKGDFLRLRNLTLGYSLPEKLFEKSGPVKKIRIYLNAQNLLTFTQYSGFDPEIGSTSPLASGIDDGVYPIPRTYMLGVRVGF
ncbi:SusC/RagA family TonB-linked outer membrane protein [Olivibacter domesticus]|uniref:TonB-linked outer membrane protein, SusC/RagA family n=1 Tax=Olivibacter domesticus TaxID=407022 RepID=A0A1H7QI76_OLID1|nr:TonB-dependent receptor [Olivibacter domesticus]SEL47643.1 TonB-linked outer membrane protein, SusC/RagA family [Olivibacter domesticus]